MNIRKLKLVMYTLQFAVFLTFFGHGYLALNGKLNWIPYLQTVGLNFDNSLRLMPFIGVLDIVIAIIILFKPNRVVVLWAVCWGFSTALIRPLSGEDIWSFIERGANWGAPLALYFLLKNNKY